MAVSRVDFVDKNRQFCNAIWKMRVFTILHTYCLLLLFGASSFSIIGTKCIQESSSQANEIEDNLTTLVLQFKRIYPVKMWKSYGLFSDDYINRINAHWLKFPPPDKSTHYLLAALYGIIMLVGFTGNALVIFMFTRLVAQQLFLLLLLQLFNLHHCFFIG